MPTRQGGTRDSLMTNMLLSLDQLGGSPAPTGAIFEETSDGHSYGGASRDDRTWTGTKKPRSNTRSSHATSQSSDLDVGDDGAGRRTRGHRSNSSTSHFQVALARVNSLRSQPSTPKRMHSRKRSDKSSASNSIDAGYAQVITTQRWAQGFGHRSSSFDRGHRRSESNQQQAQWHFEFSNSFLESEYDAAPTPTVPGGPRRTAPSTPATAAFTLPDPPPEPKTPGLEGKRSTRSSRSNTMGRKDSKHGSGREPAPPMPLAFDMDSAPAPHVGYEKSKEPMHNPPAPSQQTPPAQQSKERPGFFKRMFGSSKTNLSSNTLDSHNSSTQFSAASMDTVERPGSQTQHVASQMKPHTPPSRDTNSSHSHHHVLQKKPSSFFRRRKKSVADQEPPPILSPEMAPPMPPLVPPISLFPVRPNKLQTGPEPSPVSSLRKVMDPYLKGSNPSTPGTHSSLQSPPLQGSDALISPEVAPAFQRDFSPDYEPSPKAVIRPVEEPEPRTVATELKPPKRRTDTPTRPPPEPPVITEKRNNSFLNLDEAPSDTDPDTSGHPVEKRSSFAEPTSRLNSEVRPTLQPSPSFKDRNEDTIRADKRKTRLPIDVVESEEDGQQASLALPIEGARSASRASISTGAEVKTDVSAHADESPTIEVTMENQEPGTLDEPDFVVGHPTDDDRRKAQKIFDGNEDFIQREKAAAWMGEEGLVRQRTLQAYMELYGFQNVSIIDSLRQICERLVFRAETQQVDRILVAFSSRWADCNANHGFRANG